MAQEPDRLAFRFGVVIAVAVIVLTIMTWAGPPNPESASVHYSPLCPYITLRRRPHRSNSPRYSSSLHGQPRARKVETAACR
jgi:hypothetical protein